MEDVRSIGAGGHAAAQRGELAVADQAVARLKAATTAEATAWVMAIRAARWHAVPEPGALPAAAALEAAVGAPLPVRRPMVLAAASSVSAALLRFDGRRVAELASLSERLIAGDPEEGEPTLRAALVRAWDRLLGGDLAGLAELADTLRQAAQRCGAAAVVIEAESLRALALLDAEDPGAALAAARRAARMAQAEGLPQPQYLAHLVLARVRRQGGASHLATRIIAALARVAPAPWRAWLAWERMLAGGDSPLSDPDRSGAIALDVSAPPGLGGDDRAGPATAALALLLAAAARGERADLDAALAALRATLDGARGLKSEVDWLAALLDPDADLAAAPVPTVAWCAGVGTLAPGGLHGVCLAAAADAEGTASDVAIVLARAAGARRLLRIGELLVKDRDVLRLTTGRQARNDTTLAVLALAGGSGLPDAELFEAVYGFAFVPARHDGVLGVLLHRVRQRLGEGGVIERDGGRTRLTIAAPLVVVDPRCTRTVDDRVLHIVAESGRADARTAARRLGLPLRTVQGALAQLVSEGVCRRERSGRHIEYVVEDTTFMEPTRA